MLHHHARTGGADKNPGESWEEEDEKYTLPRMKKIADNYNDEVRKFSCYKKHQRKKEINKERIKFCRHHRVSGFPVQNIKK